MESPISLSRELRSFVDNNIDNIRSRSLRVPSLDEVEAIYKQSSINFYRLESDASWDDIKDAYFKDIESWIAEIPNTTKNEKKELVNEMKLYIKAELRRYMMAKFLQLNKFTATAEQVIRDLERLQQLVES